MDKKTGRLEVYSRRPDQASHTICCLMTNNNGVATIVQAGLSSLLRQKVRHAAKPCHHCRCVVQKRQRRRGHNAHDAKKNQGRIETDDEFSDYLLNAFLPG